MFELKTPNTRLEYKVQQKFKVIIKPIFHGGVSKRAFQ